MVRLGERMISELGQGLIRALLLFYPRSFRRKFGPEIVALFTRQPYGHSQPIGRWALLGLWARTVRGLLLTLLVEQITNLLGLVADAVQRFRELFGGEAASGREEESKRVAGQGWLEGLRQDVWYGLRVLGRSPGFTAIAMLILGLGIGANTALFALVHNTFFYPLPFQESERIVAVFSLFEDDVSGTSRRSLYHTLQKRERTFEAVVAHHVESGILTSPGSAARIAMTGISPGWLRTLGIEPALGRPFTPEEEKGASAEAVALISDSLWTRRFARSPEAVGAYVTVEGRSYRVVGILPPGFKYPWETDLWIPSPLALARHPKNPPIEHTNFLYILGRLRPGVTLLQAQTGLEALAHTLPPAVSGGEGRPRLLALPLREELLEHDEQDRMALLLWGLVFLFLLMASLSVTNMLLARSVSRRKEMVIRAALGASRRRQVRQLLVESLLLSLLGMLSGLVFVAWAGPYVNVLVPQALTDQFGVRQVVVDERVLGFSLGAAFLTCLLCGVVPALKSASIDRLPMLHAKGLGGTPRRPHRDLGALVMVQMALAMVLLAGAGHMIKYWWRSERQDPGLRANGVLTMRISLPESGFSDWSKQLHFLAQVRQAVRSVPGVEQAGVMSANPVCCGCSVARLETGVNAIDSADPAANLHFISPGTVEALGLRLLRGRLFTPEDNENSKAVALVSEALARRLWPGEDPIGKRLRLKWEGPPWRTVVGVVATIPAEDFQGETWYASLYQPPHPWNGLSFHLMVRSLVGPRTVRRGVVGAIRNLDSNIAINDIATMEEVYATAFGVDRKSTAMLSFLAAFGLLLAAVGTYGVMSYTVGQSVHELSLRVVLGAHLWDIWRMVLRRGLLLAVVGIVAGLAGGIVLVQLLDEVFPAGGHLDPNVFFLSAIVLLISALVACYIPARRATRLDPLVALRSS